MEDLGQVRLGHRIDLCVLSSISDTILLGKRNHKGDLFNFSQLFLLDSSEIKWKQIKTFSLSQHETVLTMYFTFKMTAAGEKKRGKKKHVSEAEPDITF